MHGAPTQCRRVRNAGFDEARTKGAWACTPRRLSPRQSLATLDAGKLRGSTWSRRHPGVPTRSASEQAKYPWQMRTGRGWAHLRGVGVWHELLVVLVQGVVGEMHAPPFDVLNIVKLGGKPTQPFFVEVHHQRVPARHLHRISRGRQQRAAGCGPMAGAACSRAGRGSHQHVHPDVRLEAVDEVRRVDVSAGHPLCRLHLLGQLLAISVKVDPLAAVRSSRLDDPHRLVVFGRLHPFLCTQNRSAVVEWVWVWRGAVAPSRAGAGGGAPPASRAGLGGRTSAACSRRPRYRSGFAFARSWSRDSP
eukprot:scaffold12461_cov67-Phaeocystis_antarctica.AAC.13